MSLWNAFQIYLNTKLYVTYIPSERKKNHHQRNPLSIFNIYLIDFSRTYVHVCKY